VRSKDTNDFLSSRAPFRTNGNAEDAEANWTTLEPMIAVLVRAEQLGSAGPISVLSHRQESWLRPHTPARPGVAPVSSRTGSACQTKNLLYLRSFPSAFFLVFAYRFDIEASYHAAPFLVLFSSSPHCALSSCPTLVSFVEHAAVDFCFPSFLRGIQI